MKPFTGVRNLVGGGGGPGAGCCCCRGPSAPQLMTGLPPGKGLAQRQGRTRGETCLQPDGPTASAGERHPAVTPADRVSPLLLTRLFRGLGSGKRYLLSNLFCFFSASSLGVYRLVCLEKDPEDAGSPRREPPSPWGRKPSLLFAALHSPQHLADAGEILLLPLRKRSGNTEV